LKISVIRSNQNFISEISLFEINLFAIVVLSNICGGISMNLEKMSLEEIEKILEKHHPIRRWETEFAPEDVTIDDLNEEEIHKTRRKAIDLGRMSELINANTESILRELNLIKDGRLINAAVVLYGKNERLFIKYPQLIIRLARFKGIERKNIIDNRQYYGSAFDLLNRGEQFLLDFVPISTRLISWV
jgi:ATP-dependent DNA helicase RecG